MSWVWVLPAVCVVTAVVVAALALRRVSHQARALQASLRQWNQLAVAVADLDHDAQRAGANLRRLTRR